MARQTLIAGNWKMNLTHLEAIGLVQKIVFTVPTSVLYSGQIKVVQQNFPMQYVLPNFKIKEPSGEKSDTPCNCMRDIVLRRMDKEPGQSYLRRRCVLPLSDLVEQVDQRPVRLPSLRRKAGYGIAEIGAVK